jgi:FG-GAP-like repeat
VSCRTVSGVPKRVAIAVAAFFLCVVPARADFVPALGSPFDYGTAVHALAVADSDRNGTLDVAAGGITLRRGNGTGFLGSAIALGAPGAVEGLASADLSGDGLPDYVAIAPGVPRRLMQYTAVPGGGYFEAQVPVGGSGATEVALADLTGDGLSELIVARAQLDPNVTVLRNLGSGAFTDPLSFDEDAYASGLVAPGDLAVGDLTGDGRNDVVVAGSGGSLSVLVTNAGGDQTAGELSATGAAGAAERVALAQLDGDGRLDAVATDSAGTPSVVPLRGDGAGGLEPLGRWATGLPSPPSAVGTGDVNGDGAVDAVAGSAGGRYAVLLGDGTGGASAGSPSATGDPADGSVDDLAVADMNRDGQLDVVTANRPGSVSVLLNAGTGLMQASPAAFDFGAMPARSAPHTRTVTLRSTRGQLRITRVDLHGSRSYSAGRSGCLGRTLLLGQSCSMSVTFTPPRRAGRTEALLSVDANAAAVVVPLTAAPRPPIVSGLRLRPRRSRAGGRMALRYTLSEAARVRVLVQRALPGRRVSRRRCVTPRRSNLRRRRCTLWQTVAKLPQRGVAGPNRLRLRARAQGRPLPPGRHRLSVSAADRFRNRSKERPLRFRVVPRQAARRAK